MVANLSLILMIIDLGVVAEYKATMVLQIAFELFLF